MARSDQRIRRRRARGHPQVSGDALQVFGTAAFAAFAGMLGYIGLHTKAFGRYGQEALLCASASMVTVVGVRTAVLTEHLSQADARTLNGVFAFTFLAILAQLMLVKRRAERVRSRLLDPPGD